MTTKPGGTSADLSILGPQNIEDPTFDSLIIFGTHGLLIDYRRQFSHEFMKRHGT